MTQEDKEIEAWVLINTISRLRNSHEATPSDHNDSTDALDKLIGAQMDMLAAPQTGELL